MKKKIWAVLMALVLCISMAPTVAKADNKQDCRHNWDFENPKYVSNNDGTHNMVCRKCGEKGAFTYNCKSNDGNYDKVCDQCGYNWGKPVCEHDWDFENPKYVSNNDGTHNMVCKKCGEKGAYTYNCKSNDLNYDKVCDQCGYNWGKTDDQQDCEHDWDFENPKYVSNNDGTHNIVCKKCGEKGTYTYKCKSNDDNYDKICDKCGYSWKPHEHSYVTHSLENGTHEMSCTCGDRMVINCLDSNGDGKCDSCEYVFEKPEVKPHEHNYITHSLEDGTHETSCTCGSRVVVDCADYNGDGKCDICGYVFEKPEVKPHEHNYVTHSLENGTHETSCTCGNRVVIKCSDSNGDSKCDSCGYVFEKPEVKPHEHNFVAHSNNDGTHDLSCNCGRAFEDITCLDADGDGKCDSCGYEKYVPDEEPHEHNYVAHSNNDGTHEMSCTCGGSVQMRCFDNDGDRFCDSCGYELFKHTHSLEIITSNEDGTHKISCTCGEFVELSCLDNDGDNKCDSCGYEKYIPDEEPHEHNYVAHSNNDGTHDLSCNCGNSAEGLTCLDMDGDNKCDSCGYEKYVPEVKPHEHNYVAHTNNDGTHDLSCNCGLGEEDVECVDADEDGKCDACGYEIPVVECEHEFVGVVDNKDGVSHNVVCRDCLEVVEENVPHEYKDGVCACGAIEQVEEDKEPEEEQKPEDNTDKGESPVTGDSVVIMPVVLALLVSAACVVAVMRKRVSR